MSPGLAGRCPVLVRRGRGCHRAGKLERRVGVDSENPLTGLSCPSATLCVATDGSGDIVTSTNPENAGSWQVAAVDTPDDSIDQVSCPSAALCVAVDDSGDVLTSTNPAGGASAWQTADIDGTGTLTGISCPTVTLCVAVDDDGVALVSTNPAGGRAHGRAGRSTRIRIARP